MLSNQIKRNILFENDEYYIGEFKNGLMNRKGIIYYKYGKVIYFWDFVVDKFEGSGNLYYQIYDYYIGEWKDGLRHGKGAFYYKNRNIKFEGDFIRNIAEGNRKYIYKDGGYYHIK